VSYVLVAILGGPVPGRLRVVPTETLAIHLSLPFMLVTAVAYAAERRRIAWELHNSAKQRLHAAHLLVTSLSGRVLELDIPLRGGH
jgi:signal transduction histidine kinase